jgi:hypothetical protein
MAHPKAAKTAARSGIKAPPALTKGNGKSHAKTQILQKNTKVTKTELLLEVDEMT